MKLGDRVRSKARNDLEGFISRKFAPKPKQVFVVTFDWFVKFDKFDIEYPYDEAELELIQ